MKRNVILDCECNGLKPDKVHVIVCVDINTEEVFEFRQNECYEKFPDWFRDNVSYVYGHNLLDYDIPLVLLGLLGLNIDIRNVTDTFVLSRLACSDRYNRDVDSGLVNRIPLSQARILKLKPHSLEAFGIRVGRYKPEIEDWSTFSEEMVTRCREDCFINLATLKVLNKELEKFSKYSIRLEHRVAAIIGEMTRNGVAIDIDTCMSLYNECKEKADSIRKDLVSEIPPMIHRLEDSWVEPKITEVKVWTGEYVLNEKGRKVKKYDIQKTISSQTKYYKAHKEAGLTIRGPFSPIDIEPFNPDSPDQRLRVLEEAGWKPVNFSPPTPKMKKEGIKRGSPKTTDEDNLDTLPADAPKSIHKLSDYIMFTNRWKLAESWVKLAVESGDGKIHGYVDSIGTPTGRCRHNSPNTANIVSVESEDGKPLEGYAGKYGWECRKCFTVTDKEKYCLVGFDASSLEIRMLAHYMDDPLFTYEVLNGDIYTKIKDALGLPTRKMAKGFFLSMIYGAGDKKLGLVAGTSERGGGILREKLMDFLPNFRKLTDRIQEEAKRGYLIGLDGRILWVRKPHAALNTLLQSAGAIVMKQCMMLAYNEIKAKGLDSWFVLFVHDEYQLETLKEHAEQVGNILTKAIKDAGETFQMKISLAGEWRKGEAWSNTH